MISYPRHHWGAPLAPARWDLWRHAAIGLLGLGAMGGMLASLYFVFGFPLRQLGVLSLPGIVLLAAVGWRYAIAPVFVILFVEGFLRNWFNDPALLLLKEAVLAGIYVGFAAERLLSRQRLAFSTALHLPLLCFAGLVVVQMFNPRVLSFAVALIGLKGYLYYVPLMYVAYHYFQSKQQFMSFLKLLYLLALPVALYGVVQFYQGPDSVVRLGPGFRKALFVTTGAVYDVIVFRPIATFAWPTNYAVFICLFLFLTLATAAFRERPVARFSQLCLLVFLVAFLTGGQRSAFVTVPLAIAVMLAVQRRFALLVRLGVGLAAAGVLLTLLGATVVKDRFLSIGTEWGKRTMPYFLSTLWALEISGLIGVGTGMSARGARHVLEGAMPVTWLETFHARLIVELSVLGLMLWLWFAGAALWQGYRIFHRLRDPDLKALVAGIWTFLLWSLTTQTDLEMVFIPFWLLLGVMLKSLQWDNTGVPSEERPKMGGGEPRPPPQRVPRARTLHEERP